jgi:hypothetical protein
MTAILDTRKYRFQQRRQPGDGQAPWLASTVMYWGGIDKMTSRGFIA